MAEYDETNMATDGTVRNSVPKISISEEQHIRSQIETDNRLIHNKVGPIATEMASQTNRSKTNNTDSDEESLYENTEEFPSRNAVSSRANGPSWNPKWTINISSDDSSSFCMSFYSVKISTIVFILASDDTLGYKPERYTRGKKLKETIKGNDTIEYERLLRQTLMESRKSFQDRGRK